MRFLSIRRAATVALLVTPGLLCGCGGVAGFRQTDSDGGTGTGSGNEAGGNATDGNHSDGNAIDGSSSDDSETDENVGDGAVSVADGAVGVDGIYRSCPPVALTQSYADPNVGFSLRYPASWSGGSCGVTSNSCAVFTSYSYLPSPASTPITGEARVNTSTGTTAVDMADLERRLNENASGVPSAVVRRFTLGGEPAIAWWFRATPAQPGCAAPVWQDAANGAGCQVDTGPDFIVIRLDAAKGLSIIQLVGSARINAPDQIFCDIQAIAASLSP
jgi:hypothetical protein